MEVERTNCASKGMAGTGLGLGIAGTALGLLNGGLGGLWGGAVPMAAAQVACSENTGVNRFELEQERTISNKDMEIAYWRGQDETNRKITDAYTKLENRINGVASEVRANKDEQAGINLQQAVYNGTNTAALACLQNQVAQLQGMTKMVIPNSSVCPGWGNATVSVSPGTTTT
nr:MAG TPA: hypothetical protein [Caudoviricetes sp.]